MTKHHDRLAKHFETTHGPNITAISAQLAPRFTGAALPPPLAVVPPAQAHNAPKHAVEQPIVRPSATRRRRRKTQDGRGTDSLFGSSSDSDPEASSSQSQLSRLASPRKKRGALITSSQPAAVRTMSSSRASPRPINSEDTYGDPPEGEYKPRGSFEDFPLVPWLNWELPERRVEGQLLETPPPIDARSAEVVETPATRLDREPRIVSKFLERGKSQGETQSASAAWVPTLGFEKLWEEIKPTPLGQKLEKDRADEEEAVAAKRRKRAAEKGKAKVDSWPPRNSTGSLNTPQQHQSSRADMQNGANSSSDVGATSSLPARPGASRPRQ